MNETRRPPAKERFGLSGKLLGLTILFVLIAEVLIYVPWMSTFYERWLADRAGRATSVALVLEAAPSGMVPENLARELLESVGARLIVLKTGETRRLLASADPPPELARDIDLRERDPWSLTRDAFDTLIFGSNRTFRMIGPAPLDGEYIEVVFDEAPLRRDMLAFSANILLVTIIVGAIVAMLLYFALDRIIVQPVRRLTRLMSAFAENPEDTTRIIVPSARSDEIGTAETALAAMQRELHGQLQSRGRLAALGLAVAKINHDLRNLLASAQLASERLGSSRDPMVRSMSDKLVSTLERAVAYCRSTLAYGAAPEPEPVREKVELASLTREVREALALGEGASIAWIEAIDRDLVLDADREQLFRVLLNIGRNSVQALEGRGDPDPERDQIRITARREGSITLIEISDTGPGLNAKARSNLFAAFQGSTRAGGTGLGLAIAAEIVRAHGGEIHLVDGTVGATFRFTIPDRPIDLMAHHRARARA